MVKFREVDGKEVSWALPGLEEKGLCPITKKRGSWFLDRCRMHPVLKIHRWQLPLAPAFAMTAHAAQGQTLRAGAIVDLCIGKGSNPLGSYVAMTRVTRREDLLIYLPAIPTDTVCPRAQRRARSALASSAQRTN